VRSGTRPTRLIAETERDPAARVELTQGSSEGVNSNVINSSLEDSPGTIHAVGVELGVGTHDIYFLGHRVRDQKAIKRIAVMTG
jgi:hypothetical protein